MSTALLLLPFLAVLLGTIWSLVRWRRRRSLVVPVLLTAACVVVAGANASIIEHRLNHKVEYGSCQASPTMLNGDRVEFEAECSFWVSRVSVKAPEGVEKGTDNLGTEPDFLVAVGGPGCRIRDGLFCEGMVDADERFTGWVEPAGDPCDGPVELFIDGGACSETPSGGCDDVGFSDEIRLPPPAECGE
jgi:hypothetical protein